MAESFLGEIRLFGFRFPPRGWATCSGQLVSQPQNTALFALLGTDYGGDGRSTFGLPDLRSRVPVGQGQGPGLSPYTVGQMGGAESVALIPGELPSHTHSALGTAGGGDALVPTGNVWAADAAGGSAPYSSAPSDVELSPGAIGYTGGNLGHENRSPYLCLNFCIAMQGIFPSRD